MITDILTAILLGLVEGVTEFLPVSSTGHLILAGDLLGFNGEKAKTFEVFIQLGAILAVVWLYREKVLFSLKDKGGKRTSRFIMNLFAAFMPAAILGYLFHSAIKKYLFTPFTVSIALIAGGIAIILIERLIKNPGVSDIDEVPLKKALGIGLAQTLSLLPGVSRAGATIMGGMCLGLDRKAATEFSFFLAIPTMFAATAYDILKNVHNLNAGDIPLFAAGFAVSFVSAVLVIKAFLGYIAGHTFNSFAVYRIIFGAAVLAYYA